MMTDVYDIVLDCGHTQPFVTPCPVAGETIICFTCSKDAVVLKGHPVRLRLRCNHCRFTRPVAGDDPDDYTVKKGASITAYKHVFKHRHSVRLVDHGRVLEEYRPDDDATVLPF